MGMSTQDLSSIQTFTPLPRHIDMPVKWQFLWKCIIIVSVAYMYHTQKNEQQSQRNITAKNIWQQNWQFFARYLPYYNISNDTDTTGCRFSLSLEGICVKKMQFLSDDIKLHIVIIIIIIRNSFGL